MLLTSASLPALLHTCRAECEDRLRAEFRIEMNAAVAESEQRWQNREQEMQTQISELQKQLNEEQVSLPPGRGEPSVVLGLQLINIFTSGV